MNKFLLYGFVILLGFGLIYERITHSQTSEYYDISKIENKRLSEKLGELEYDIQTRDKEIFLLKDSSINRFKIKSIKGDNIPDISASVYQDNLSGKTWLIVHKPSPLPKDQKYQLWGIINNEFIKAPTFQISLTGMQYLKKIPVMDSFSITIEPMGAVDMPSTKQIVTTTRF